MIPQSAFMICADIRDGELPALRSFLATMNSAPGIVDSNNAVIPFAQLDRLHFSRLLVIDLQVGEDIKAHNVEPRPWTDQLVFVGDCDGTWESVLVELALRASPGLKQLFSFCEGFDADTTSLFAWMKERNKAPSANYINWLGRTLNQVREERQLHEILRMQTALLHAKYPTISSSLLHQTLREFVAQEIGDKRLTLTPAPRTPWLWKLRNFVHMICFPLVMLLLLPLLVVLLPFFLIVLRLRENADPEVLPKPEPKRVIHLAQSEDQLITNQFSAFGDVKPGLFRRYTLVFLLYVLNYSARHIYNKGYLTRVRTIHFARWVLLDDRNRLLFLSNYDGSLESYMDDFINKVAWGLNLVFSNGVGYPRSRFLVKQGAEQEQKFKRYLRNHQLATDVWYKAYPDLTTFDLARNTRIRQGLENAAFRDETEIRQWLSLI